MPITELTDPFVLDVRVVTDIHASEVIAPCETDDGCGSTCASACTSNA
jgi:FxLD family lantipeptide